VIACGNMKAPEQGRKEVTYEKGIDRFRPPAGARNGLGRGQGVRGHVGHDQPKLDGTMTCVVTDLGNNQWRGHFTGEWQGVAFSYTVGFSGPPEKLHGTAVIDGADYEWTGVISKGPPGSFKGSFGGSRYGGRFNLKLMSK